MVKARLLLKSSAVILAGGFSRRFGQNKGLIDLAGKPLVLHVVDRVSKVVDETVVAVSSSVQKETFESLLDRRANVVVDKHEAQSPLVGALAGFESAEGEYSLLLPCDTPFISIQIAQSLLDICVNRGAVIPKWSNEYIEPLQAAYHTKSALTATKKAWEQGKLDLRSMIARLKGVRYVSTMVLRQMDPKLLTFFNINTPEDLKRAEPLLK
jgi:molybdopterin-guanine dinucleotide biosynthesis protein A